MIIKWPERYSLVLLFHAFIHELKYRIEMTNKQQEPQQKTTTRNATKYDVTSERITPANQMNETVYAKKNCSHKLRLPVLQRIFMKIHFHIV